MVQRRFNGSETVLVQRRFKGSVERIQGLREIQRSPRMARLRRLLLKVPARRRLALAGIEEVLLLSGVLKVVTGFRQRTSRDSGESGELAGIEGAEPL